MFRIITIILIFTCGHIHALSTAPSSGYPQVHYPIVLIHGIFGFDSILGIDYWYGIADALASEGAEVYVSSVSNSHAPEIRGEQLIINLDELAAIIGHTKFNLIGDSLGAPT